VRNSGPGESEDAEALVRCADKGSGETDPPRIQPQVGQIAENIADVEFNIAEGSTYRHAPAAQPSRPSGAA
jgi:hypothetical protein